MKIKIGNFNFISDKENKYNSYDKLDDYAKYFYLDGKEDTLYVTDISNFEDQRRFPEYYKYEKELAEKYNVIHVYGKVREQIRKYIKSKTQYIFDNRSYSKYELYKGMDFGSISRVVENNKFAFSYEDKLVMDFDSNRINIGKYQFNPYTEKVENLDELYKDGIFKEAIKSALILKEIENEVAPPYISEIEKINKFMREKETVNVLFKDMEKFKSRASIGHFLRYYNGIIEIGLGYQEENNFKKANPGKKEEDLKINNLMGISYGKNVLEIDSMALANIDMQIAISPEDRLKLRIENLKEEIKDKFNEYMRALPEKYYNVYYLNDAIKQIKEIERENQEIKDGTKEGTEREYPDWYKKELNEIFYKYNLANSLEKCQTLDEIKEICVELEDKELKEIYYSLLNGEGNIQENELAEEI